MSKTVCVIGAGVAGISAVKSCLEEGLEPTCYEFRSDIGGTWNYVKSERSYRSRAYQSLVTNVSKEASCFSDFPFPKEFCPYVGHAKMLEYLTSYVDHFGLSKHITCNAAVEKLEQNEATGNGPRKWKVTTRDRLKDVTTTTQYDCVMICTGLNSSPKMPNKEGLNDGTFRGKVIHSCEYDTPDEFEGKNVIVIGLGNSGADIAVDVSRNAKTTILSSRSGAWMVPRNFDNGLPPDMTATTRLKSLLQAGVPEFIGSWIARRLINSAIDHKSIGVECKYGPMNSLALFLVNDELPARIFSGKVRVKPDVKRFNENEVVFLDGSKAEIDVVICASGYDTKFPFVSDDILPDRRSEVRLYEWMVPFEIENPETVAVIGFVPPGGGSALPIFECQTRYIAQVMSGKTKLPPVSEMKKHFENVRSQFKGHGDSFCFRTRLGVTYQDEIAVLGGFYPGFWHLLFRDPLLALAVHTGPFMGYHYRLVGRHTWSGARDRIFNAKKNTLYGLGSVHAAIE